MKDRRYAMNLWFEYQVEFGITLLFYLFYPFFLKKKKSFSSSRAKTGK